MLGCENAVKSYRTSAVEYLFGLSTYTRMASQRVLLFTVGGPLADSVWQNVCRWSDARTSAARDEWSPDHWPASTRDEVDRFVERLTTSCYTPPILYRSEHVDCWSMGDVFDTALVKGHPDYCRRLLTTSHEIIATWVRFSEQIVPDKDAPPETHWLYARINEAIAAWGEFAEDRLVVLVRSVLGGLWTDEEVAEALRGIPSWWSETEQGGGPERAVAEVFDSG
jgi:hypothetical protein